MFTDAARAASAQVRAATAVGPAAPVTGGNVARQGAAAQASFGSAARASRPYGGSAKGGGASARPASGAAPAAAPAAHGSGVAAVARSMGGNASQNDTRPDRTRIDQLKAASAPSNSSATERNSNAIDGAASRASAGSMVGDHTTPPALQKYID